MANFLDYVRPVSADDKEFTGSLPKIYGVTEFYDEVKCLDGRGVFRGIIQQDYKDWEGWKILEKWTFCGGVTFVDNLCKFDLRLLGHKKEHIAYSYTSWDVYNLIKHYMSFIRKKYWDEFDLNTVKSGEVASTVFTMAIAFGPKKVKDFLRWLKNSLLIAPFEKYEKRGGILPMVSYYADLRNDFLHLSHFYFQRLYLMEIEEYPQIFPFMQIHFSRYYADPSYWYLTFYLRGQIEMMKRVGVHEKLDN